MNDHVECLQVGGMTCSSCVSRIESNVLKLRGVESCTVSLATSVASVEYSPSEVGPRDIIDAIQVGHVPKCYRLGDL